MLGAQYSLCNQLKDLSVSLSFNNRNLNSLATRNSSTLQSNTNFELAPSTCCCYAGSNVLASSNQQHLRGTEWSLSSAPTSPPPSMSPAPGDHWHNAAAGPAANRPPRGDQRPCLHGWQLSSQEHGWQSPAPPRPAPRAPILSACWRRWWVTAPIIDSITGGDRRDQRRLVHHREKKPVTVPKSGVVPAWKAPTAVAAAAAAAALRDAAGAAVPPPENAHPAMNPCLLSEPQLPVFRCGERRVHRLDSVAHGQWRRWRW